MRSDEYLYEQLIRGDMAAFDLLYQRYERPLFGFIRRYVSETTDAEEIFHEAFLAVLRERQKSKSVSSFKAWLYRITRNLCLNRLRNQDRSKKAMSKLVIDLAPESTGPESSLIQAQTNKKLQLAVSQLPDYLGELYSMRASGMSYKGLAQVLDIPIGTVKSRMNTLLRLLREEMSK